jgi:hypothetical protein
MPSVLLRRGNQVAGWTPAMASVLAEACFVQEMAFYRINRYHPDIMLMVYAIDNRMEATPRGFLPSGKFLAAIVENTCRIPGQRSELEAGFSNTREI